MLPTVPTVTLATLVTCRSAMVCTVSVSLEEQTPATVQDADGLLFETVDGGEIVATLVTEVWAMANKGAKNVSHSNAASTYRAASKPSRNNRHEMAGPNPFTPIPSPSKFITPSYRNS